MVYAAGEAAVTGLERDLVADCKRAADAMVVYVEWVSQRGGKHSGTSKGAPDCFVYVAGKVVPVEFKRAKHHDGTPAGRLSLDQNVAIERRLKQGVETHVVESVQGFANVVNAARTGRAAG